MFIGYSSRSFLGVALGCLFLGACGAEDLSGARGNEAEPGEVGEVTDGLANAFAPNGLGDGGTVMLDVWNGTGWQRNCSAQIVARDAILTSGHCFRFFGRPAGNRWAFVVWRQRLNGTWANHTLTAANSGWMWGTIMVHPQYAGVQQSNGTWTSHSAITDLGILRLDANLVGIDASDTTYLDNGVQLPRTAQLWGYGSGALRQGPYPAEFDFGVGLYRSFPAVTAPRACPGDSGAPLKRSDSLFEQDGIQIAVHSSVTGNCLAAGSVTLHTAIQPNMSFITGALPGRCTDVTSLSTIGPVQLKRCW
jgi:hypothetical protein